MIDIPPITDIPILVVPGVEGVGMVSDLGPLVKFAGVSHIASDVIEVTAGGPIGLIALCMEKAILPPGADAEPKGSEVSCGKCAAVVKAMAEEQGK